MWHAWRHVRPIAAAAQRRWGRVALMSSSGRTSPPDGDWFAEIVKLARSLPQETLAAAVAEAERRKLTPAATFSTLLSPPQRERGGSSRARRRGADGPSELDQVPDEAPMPTGNAALVALSSNELGTCRRAPRGLLC